MTRVGRRQLLTAIAALCSFVGPRPLAAQTCPLSIRLEQLELWAATRDTPPKSSKLSQLELPLSGLNDSLWLIAKIKNAGRGDAPLVRVYANVGPIVGPVLYKRDRGMEFPNEALSWQSRETMAAIWTTTGSTSIQAGELKELKLGPFRMRDAIPFLGDTITWNALVLGLHVEGSIMVFVSGGKCYDSPSDNRRTLTVRVRNIK